MVHKKAFRLGDIIELNTDEYDGLLMIVSFSNKYYNAIYIEGCFDGEKAKVYDPNYYVNVCNIFDKERK